MNRLYLYITLIIYHIRNVISHGTAIGWTASFLGDIFIFIIKVQYRSAAFSIGMWYETGIF